MIRSESQRDDDNWIDVGTATPVEKTLEERGKRYGDFDKHAAYTQAIKRIMSNSGNWNGMSHSQREALEMIAHKIGRILNGDPDYSDSWHDIAGYARLVEQELEQQ